MTMISPAASSELLRTRLGAIYGAAELDVRPCLFSAVTIPLDDADRQRMAALAAAVERVAANPVYQSAILGASLPTGGLGRAAGVCMGFDFHLTADGPKLIEINTNAGGLALVADLMSAWGLAGEAVLTAAVDMFRAEWALERGAAAGPLRRIAIVDEQPEAQYLAPEFHRFRTLFEQHGIAAVIADPSELVWDGSCLRHQGNVVDLVYNRLTDFALAAPAQAALLAAWQARATVVSPHPLAHRLLADKRNLERLADAEFRATLGLSDADERVFADALLPIRRVRAEDAELLWSTRKQWFFKPAAGYGSKAVYRGDKMTRRVFDEVLAGDYVAQAFAPPAEFPVPIAGGEPVVLKYDVRNYTYRGKVLAVAARLYQGQTTNFRTPGGGFAPMTGA